MFNDKYGLTKAVLEGKKTQTRRVIQKSQLKNIEKFQEEFFNGTLDFLEGKELLEQYFLVEGRKKPRYAVGEVLAVAQCLKDLGYDPRDTSNGHIWGLEHTPGWTNKMFVSASDCIHQIRITNIRLQRLKDISDEYCLKEGVRRWEDEKEYLTDKTVRKSVDELKAAGYDAYAIPGCWGAYPSAREAYASLIDRISGKGTWDKNPWVFVYDFELIK